MIRRSGLWAVANRWVTFSHAVVWRARESIAREIAGKNLPRFYRGEPYADDDGTAEPDAALE